MSRRERIVSDPEIVHGRPTVRGTRVTVQTILELLAAGETTDDILTDDDELHHDDILAALEYGAAVTGGSRVDFGAA